MTDSGAQVFTLTYTGREMNYISEWFPFTREELSIAFRAIGLADDEVEQAVSSMAEALSGVDPDEGAGSSGFGDFLAPIAALSDEAAARVQAYRSRWVG